jgi:hypothetical protein
MTGFDQQLSRLQQQVDKFYEEGAPPLAKGNAAAEPATASKVMSGDEFMAKALCSVAAGHITTAQLTEAEYCITAGRRPAERIVRAVVDGVAYNPFG